MGAALLLLIGAFFTSTMGVLVQLASPRVAKGRSERRAARVIYQEIWELGNLEINSSGPTDPSHLYKVWCQNRADLAELGKEVWEAADEAVLWAVHPEQFVNHVPESHNSRFERALMLLEPRSGLPRALQIFSEVSEGC